MCTITTQHIFGLNLLKALATFVWYNAVHTSIEPTKNKHAIVHPTVYHIVPP